MALQTLTEFMARWTNTPVDFDGKYPNQCVDLVQYWSRDGLGGPRLVGAGAVNVWTTYNPDFFERVPNLPANHPEPTDIIIWTGPNIDVGTSAFGHIAVCVDATTTNFRSFDADWPVGSLPHIQSHNYTAVLGWLRKKTPVGTADYAAAAWVASLQEMTAHVPVAQCAAKKAEIKLWLQTHG